MLKATYLGISWTYSATLPRAQLWLTEICAVLKSHRQSQVLKLTSITNTIFLSTYCQINFGSRQALCIQLKSLHTMSFATLFSLSFTAFHWSARSDVSCAELFCACAMHLHWWRRQWPWSRCKFFVNSRCSSRWEISIATSGRRSATVENVQWAVPPSVWLHFSRVPSCTARVWYCTF